MPINRYYISDLSPHVTSIKIEGDEFHHMTRVTRQNVGSQVEIIDGKGHLLECKIVDIQKHIATLHIEKKMFSSLPTSLFSLAIPLMRRSKLEWIVEKATELGCHSFLFYHADFSDKETLSQNDISRLRTLSISALKQSGGLYLPSFEIFSSLSLLFKNETHYYFGAFDGKKLSVQEKPAVFITGPESGFSPKELSLLKEKGVGICLNSQVLRAETAPIVAISIYNYLLS